MAKKTTKKIAAKKIAAKKTTKKIAAKKTEESASLSVMIFAIMGIILLMYFGTSSSVSVDVKVEKNEMVNNDIIDESIILSGTTYESKEAAYRTLSLMPQTMMSNEERKFYFTYK